MSCDVLVRRGAAGPVCRGLFRAVGYVLNLRRQARRQDTFSQTLQTVRRVSAWASERWRGASFGDTDGTCDCLPGQGLREYVRHSTRL